MEVRGFCVQYTKRRTENAGILKKFYNKKIDHLMNQLKTDRSKENISQLYRLRAELNKIAEYRTKGAIIRSRTRWHESGEKNTKYFLNLQKRQHCKTHVSKLKTIDERNITDPKESRDQGKLFYKNLYTAIPCNISQYKFLFDDVDLVKLKETEQEELELPLHNGECLLILKQCAKGKCPGTDGLSVEF